MQVQPKWSAKDAGEYSKAISDGKKFSNDGVKLSGDKADFDENNPYYMAMDNKERKEAESSKSKEIDANSGVEAPDDDAGFELDE